MIKNKYIILIFVVLCLTEYYSYSQEFEYSNNKLIEEYSELPNKIDALFFESCSWKFIQNELTVQLYNKSISRIVINRADTVSLKYLSENIKNIQVIAITCPKTIINSNDFTSDLIGLSITDDVHDVVDILPVLGSYPKLKYLSFTLNIRNEAFAHLIDSLNANCNDLHYLDISVLNDFCLPNSIGNLSQLSYLSIYSENGNINSLEPLTPLMNLKELRLLGMKNFREVFTIKFLSNMKNLNSFLVDCEVKDYLNGLWNKPNWIKIDCEKH